MTIEQLKSAMVGTWRSLAPGLGLAYMFENMIAQHVAEGRLVRVLDKHCPQFPGYFLYYPSRVNIAPKLKALVDFLRGGQGRRGPTRSSAVSRARGKPTS